MVIEHIFVTTLEQHDVANAIGEMMSRHGFASTAQTAFAVDARVPMHTEYKKRSRRRSFRMRPASQNDYEQTVRLEFDRGRVTVAAALTGSPYDRIRVIRTRGRSKIQVEMQEEILVGLAEAIEGRLARPPKPDAERRWDDAVRASEDYARKMGRRSLIVLGVVFGLLFALVVAIVIASSK